MSTKHTPTPWAVIKLDDGLHINGYGGYLVAHCGDDNSGNAVNAALIVKAVSSHSSMVKALKIARTALEHDAPYSCWATGPNTGDPIEDLIVCPGCRGLHFIDAALSLAQDTP